MAIQFKKQIAKTPSGIIVSPEEGITNAQMKKNEADYRKTEHYKKSKNAKKGK